jgi:ABC-type transport system involved in multi-copper enzyme maturation permease subunit
MTSLPIVRRELTVAGRQPWTYHTRVVAAVLLTLLGAVILGMTGNNGPGGAAQLPMLAFKLLSSTAFAGCLLGGIILSADSISAERRSGTLGLLFLTPLGGFDVGSGKLAASGIQGLCGLLGILPILAVPLMMGGVSWAAYLTTCLALLATFALSSSVGLWASARSRSAPAAYSTALFAILAICTVPILIAWMLRGLPLIPWAIAQISPVEGLVNGWAADSVATASRNRSLISSAFAFSFAAAATLAASLNLRRTGRTGLRPASEDRPKPSRRFRRAPLPRPPARSNPFGYTNPYALQYIRRIPAVAALDWAFLLGGIAFLAFQSAAFLLPGRNGAIPMFITAMFIAYGLHVVLKIRAALAAVAPWFEEVHQGGLELLLSTPLDPSWLRDGHGVATRHSIVAHRYILTLFNVILCFSIFDDDLDINEAGVRVIFLSIFLGGIASLWADLPAITHGGFLHVLRLRKLGNVLVRTLLPILLPPWLGALVIFIAATYHVTDRDIVPWFIGLHFGHLGIAWYTARRGNRILSQNLRPLALHFLDGDRKGRTKATAFAPPRT